MTINQMRHVILFDEKSKETIKMLSEEYEKLALRMKIDFLNASDMSELSNIHGRIHKTCFDKRKRNFEVDYLLHKKEAAHTKRHIH